MANTQTDDRLMVAEVNCETGETVYRPYTDEEKERHLEAIKIYEALEAERIAKEAAKEELKKSAKAKLIAGKPLTEEEVSVIVL